MQPKSRRLVTEQNLEDHTTSELAPVRSAIEDSNYTANQALSTARSADTTSENAVDRVEQLEAMGGLAPGEVTDAQTANLLHQTESLTRSAFGSTLVAEIDDEVSEGRAALNSAAARVVDQRTASHVTGLGVGRIVVSEDPDHPLEDGDLLVLLPDSRPMFFTDFSGYETGVGLPAGWSQPWVSSNGWSIESDSSLEGGKFLRHESSDRERRLVVWDATTPDGTVYANQEVVFKWRTSTPSTGHIRAVVRGSGPETSTTGYYAGSGFGAVVAAGPMVNGNAPSVLISDISVEANTWHITRIRINGTTLSSKTWIATQPEPTEWADTVSTTHITEPGFVGLLVAGNGVNDYAFFGAGFDGATAPMEVV